MKRIVLPALLLGFFLILAYGYWFNATHGSLYVSVNDVSDREHPNSSIPVTLAFLDSSGKVLAEAESKAPWWTVFISTPSTYACNDNGPGLEWQSCFARQSRWLPTWVRKVRYVDLKSGSCEIRRKPVALSEHPDTWWLWWVPLRHIGGKPYTSFSFTINFDRSGC